MGKKDTATTVGTRNVRMLSLCGLFVDSDTHTQNVHFAKFLPDTKDRFLKMSLAVLISILCVR